MALLGYARVSTGAQDLASQHDALTAAGCLRIFEDTASGALDDRPQLAGLLDHLRGGDTLVVWRLDRLGRSLRHLIETVTALADRGVGFRSLQDRGRPRASEQLSNVVGPSLVALRERGGNDQDEAGLRKRRACETGNGTHQGQGRTGSPHRPVCNASPADRHTNTRI